MSVLERGRKIMAMKMQDTVMRADGPAAWQRPWAATRHKVYAGRTVPTGNRHDDFNYTNKVKKSARVAAKNGGSR